MKNYILDSTYKDSIILDNNDNPCITPNHTITTNINSSSIDLSKGNCSYNYISHHRFNDDLNNYSFIDYI